MPHNNPSKKRKDFSYGSERDQSYKAKRSKPTTKATGHGDFGSRNPDGSQYAPPPKKSKQVRPS